MVAASGSTLFHFPVSASDSREFRPCRDSGFPAGYPCPSHPARERAGACPSPKAQPAPGNAQATGTAPGTGISGKPPPAAACDAPKE